MSDTQGAPLTLPAAGNQAGNESRIRRLLDQLRWSAPLTMVMAMIRSVGMEGQS